MLLVPSSIVLSRAVDAIPVPPAVGFGDTFYQQELFRDARKAQHPIIWDKGASVTLAGPGMLTFVPLPKAFAIDLGGRRTARITLAGTLDFRRQVSNSVCRTNGQHSNLRPPPPLRVWSSPGSTETLRTARERLPLTEPQLTVRGLRHVHFRRGISVWTSEILTAFFKGWLLLSQPPVVWTSTQFPT